METVLKFKNLKEVEIYRDSLPAKERKEFEETYKIEAKKELERREAKEN